MLDLFLDSLKVSLVGTLGASMAIFIYKLIQGGRLW